MGPGKRPSRYGAMVESRRRPRSSCVTGRTIRSKRGRIVRRVRRRFKITAVTANALRRRVGILPIDVTVSAGEICMPAGQCVSSHLPVVECCGTPRCR